LLYDELRFPNAQRTCTDVRRSLVAMSWCWWRDDWIDWQLSMDHCSPNVMTSHRITFQTSCRVYNHDRISCHSLLERFRDEYRAHYKAYTNVLFTYLLIHLAAADFSLSPTAI